MSRFLLPLVSHYSIFEVNFTPPQKVRSGDRELACCPFSACKGNTFYMKLILNLSQSTGWRDFLRTKSWAIITYSVNVRRDLHTMVLCNPSWACCVTFSDRLVLYFCIIHVVITTWVVALLHILAHFGVQSLTASIASKLHCIAKFKKLVTYFWMEKWAHFQFTILLLLPPHPKFAPSLKMEGTDLLSSCWLHSCQKMTGSQQ